MKATAQTLGAELLYRKVNIRVHSANINVSGGNTHDDTADDRKEKTWRQSSIAD